MLEKHRSHPFQARWYIAEFLTVISLNILAHHVSVANCVIARLELLVQFVWQQLLCIMSAVNCVVEMIFNTRRELPVYLIQGE